jgi:hypothetical protein
MMQSTHGWPHGAPPAQHARGLATCGGAVPLKRNTCRSCPGPRFATCAIPSTVTETSTTQSGSFSSMLAWPSLASTCPTSEASTINRISAPRNGCPALSSTRTETSREGAAEDTMLAVSPGWTDQCNRKGQSTAEQPAGVPVCVESLTSTFVVLFHIGRYSCPVDAVSKTRMYGCHAHRAVIGRTQTWRMTNSRRYTTMAGDAVVGAVVALVRRM